MRQEMTEFWHGSGISRTIRKKSAPRSRQITTPAPHRSIFTRRMLFLTPDKQRQSTEGSSSWKKWEINGAGREMGEKYESGKKETEEE